MKVLIIIGYTGLLLWLCWLTPRATTRASLQIDAAYAQATLSLPLLQRRLADMLARDGVYPTTGGEWVVLSTSLGPEALEGFFQLDGAARIDAGWQAPPLAFLYRSDGKDYKLITHSPDLGLCRKARMTDPAAVDPMRTYYDFGTMPGPNWAVTHPEERQAAITIIKERRNLRMRDDPALLPNIRAVCGAFGKWTPGALFW